MSTLHQRVWAGPKHRRLTKLESYSGIAAWLNSRQPSLLNFAKSEKVKALGHPPFCKTYPTLERCFAMEAPSSAPSTLRQHASQRLMRRAARFSTRVASQNQKNATDGPPRTNYKN